MTRDEILHDLLDKGESGAFELWSLFGEWETTPEEQLGIWPRREEMIPGIIELLERGLLEMYCAPGGLHSKEDEWQLIGPDRWLAALDDERRWLYRRDGPAVILGLSKPAQPYVADLEFKRDWLAKLERRWPRRALVAPEPPSP